MTHGPETIPGPSALFVFNFLSPPVSPSPSRRRLPSPSRRRLPSPSRRHTVSHHAAIDGQLLQRPSPVASSPGSTTLPLSPRFDLTLFVLNFHLSIFFACVYHRLTTASHHLPPSLLPIGFPSPVSPRPSSLSCRRHGCHDTRGQQCCC